MNVIMLDGIMGSGKTLGASILAKDLQQQTGCTLYSNFGLKGSKSFTHLSDFIDVCRQPSSVIVLDESHVDLDSRNFNLNSVKFFNTIVFYLRKMRCTLMLTSPLFRNIDTRVQGVTNVYVPVKKNKTHYIYPFYDWQTLRFCKEKRIRKEYAHAIASEIMDTYAIVTPLEYPATRDEFNKLLEELKNENKKYHMQFAT
ncbi:hypothetical protein CHH59_21480 [Shouchella clausii]|uniref:hypothetical protein n=1 Tax=Shouchella clausii TaxID=79880 RepID=UPI000BA52FD3|nr:hypothetical protein [Shouchella clausii]PAF11843.1 hypothetical protein CHH59_21480 [Shouchella clausii]